MCRPNRFGAGRNGWLSGNAATALALTCCCRAKRASKLRWLKPIKTACAKYLIRAHLTRLSGMRPSLNVRPSLTLPIASLSACQIQIGRGVMSNKFQRRDWRAYRRKLNIAAQAGGREVGEIISDMITHNPGFIYTLDHLQKPNAEVGLPGYEPEAVRSHHLAIERGESPEGDCDDFTETGAEMMFRAGIDARRILKIIVADENQFYYRGYSEDKLRVSHIVAGLWLGDLPESGNVADALARNEQLFRQVIWLADTWEQARPPEARHPMVMQPGGLYNRHLPLCVSSLATGLAQYAVKGSEHILRKAGMLRAEGSVTRVAGQFTAQPVAQDFNAAIYRGAKAPCR